MDLTRVSLSQELSHYVASRIAAYPLECAENQRWLAPYVAEHQLLPLFSDWLETTGIAADGQLRMFSADGDQREYEGTRQIESRTLFVYSLVNGARSYPPLVALVPPRPANSNACPACDGLGYFKAHPDVVCTCGGLGWLPPMQPS
jgi:hypothetical protein